MNMTNSPKNKANQIITFPTELQQPWCHLSDPSPSVLTIADSSLTSEGVAGTGCTFSAIFVPLVIDLPSLVHKSGFAQ